MDWLAAAEEEAALPSALALGEASIMFHQVLIAADTRGLPMSAVSEVSTIDNDEFAALMSRGDEVNVFKHRLLIKVVDLSFDV